jgi:tetratricopeptide (TPR) repeat protein
MPPQSVLPLVLAHANAGAPGEAWRLFAEAGLAEAQDDPAALAIRGRLIKDEARAAEPAARPPIYARAAEAYAAAGALSGATFHLINAASLWRLAGDAAASETMARRVMASLDADPDEPETPYWNTATRAEALLLLGRFDEARSTLAEAVATAPRAYEDHAPTLRQFQLLTEALGRDAGWLTAFAPPRTLHFISYGAARADDAAVRAALRTRLAEEKIGFGFGALATAADLTVAEELLAGGAEVDLVLPADPELVRAEGVAVLGASWAARYDALLEAGVEVRVAGEPGGPITPASLQLAAEAAMGLAELRAGALQTEALQFIVLAEGGEADGDDEPGGPGWARRRWAASGRRQILVPAPRDGMRPRGVPVAGGRRLVASLAVGITPDLVDRVGEALPSDAGLIAPAAWALGSLLLTFGTPEAAERSARAVRAALGAQVRLAAHYGVATVADSAALGGPVLAGPALDLPRAILDGAPPGAWHVSEVFAAGLAAGRGGDRPILVGELAGTPILAF